MAEVSPETVPQPVYATTCEALDAWMAENRRGGYVYFERLELLAYMLGNEIDALRTQVDTLIAETNISPSKRLRRA